VLAGAAALALAACGPGSSGNGENTKDGPQVVGDAATALQRAGSVRLTGTVVDGGVAGQVDLRVQGTDATGQMTLKGESVQVRTTGGRTYLRSIAVFWAAEGLPAAQAAQLGDAWVELPAGATGAFTPFSIPALVDQLRTPEGVGYADAIDTTTVRGRDVVVVTGTDERTIQVAATGPPYPLQVHRPAEKAPAPFGSTASPPTPASTLTFTEFGKRTPITAPPSPVELSTLTGS
jgi:hypothetical protein